MKKYIFKNQQLLEEKQASISLHERGFLFGDGFFETLKVIDGKIFDFTLHEARIIKALQILKFSADIKNLEKNSYQLIKKNALKNGILRISISRGIGSHGYLPTYESKALIIIETFLSREIPKKISLGISEISTPGIAFKPISALPYVLTKISAQEQKKFDLVMLSAKKFVAETSSANIFWVKDEVIYTPHESCGMVLGCVRERLLKSKKFAIKKVKAKISALKNADEIFLTNSAFLVILVDDFLGKKLTKNIGKKVTSFLATLEK
jgi:branched-subunit amino acid aminotransferase/4-amino-4-deoxychorismate lyase